jgi:adenosylcobinamide-GDP ribazoletransferase
MLLPFFLTGFLHLDGFMDTCDAILSRRPLPEKLRILKDSAVGSFAVISLASLFALQYSAVFTLLDNKAPLAVLIFIPVISRVSAAAALLWFPVLPQSSYGAFFRQNTDYRHKIALIAILAAAVAGAALTTGFFGIAVAFAELIVFALAALSAVRELGGISGDLSGYALTIAEVGAVFAAALIK